ncbi:MAG: hypothetical protein COB25_018560 [Oceanospirillales bacterium]|nr:hypothetical protein [Oceanospirillales bacterium]
MSTFNEIIEQWPTVQSFATAMGAKKSTADAWKARNSIPPRYWVLLIKAAKAIDVVLTYEQLVRIASRELTP